METIADPRGDTVFFLASSWRNSTSSSARIGREAERYLYSPTINSAPSIKQGARIWAGIMSMLSGNKATIERKVEIEVEDTLWAGATEIVSVIDSVSAPDAPIAPGMRQAAFALALSARAGRRFRV